MQKNNNKIKNDQNLPQSTIKQWLNVQEKEIELRHADLYLREKEVDKDKEIAIETLKAQATDNEQIRDYHNRRHSRILKFSAGISVLIAVFFGFALLNNKDEVVFKLIEFAAVAFGAYFYGKSKKRDE